MLFFILYNLKSYNLKSENTNLYKQRKKLSNLRPGLIFKLLYLKMQEYVLRQ